MLRKCLLFVLGIFLCFLFSSSVFASDVVVNEVLYNPSSSLGDPYTNEWVEIYNKSDSQVDLGGWIIKDNIGENKIGEMGKSVKIEPRDFLVFSPLSAEEFKNKYPSCTKVYQITGGKVGNGLANGGDSVSLFDSSSPTQKINEISWDKNIGDGKSIVRQNLGDDSDWIINNEPDPCIHKSSYITPTETPTSLPPTDTPSPTKTPTPTNASTPTKSPTPSHTPTPKKTPTPSKTPTPTKKLSPTPTKKTTATPTRKATKTSKNNGGEILGKEEQTSTSSSFVSHQSDELVQILVLTGVLFGAASVAVYFYNKFQIPLDKFFRRKFKKE